MCHFNSSNDMWFQTAAKSLKVQIEPLPVTTDLFTFKRKYQKETICLKRKYQASLQKKTSWKEGKHKLLIKRKTVI